jgi:glutamine phosphoribosylpyrophosphate amidotransferase
LRVLNGGGELSGKVARQNGNGTAVLADDTNDRSHWLKRIKAFMQVAQGAYSLVLLTHEGLYALRDPLGLRPLCLGELSDGYVVASESCAILTVGGKPLREIEPGEIVRLDKNGITSFRGADQPQTSPVHL